MTDRRRNSPWRGQAPLALTVAGFVAVLALGGCGTGITIPKIPKMKFPSSHGGSAAFDIDGTTFSVSQSGHISASFPDAPQLTYSGPLGCKGRYFTAHYTEHIEVFFRYLRSALPGAGDAHRDGPREWGWVRMFFGDAVGLLDA